MNRYVAVIYKDGKTGYKIEFPDFPHLIERVSTPESINEVIDKGREALASHAERMRRNGKAIPIPTSDKDFMSKNRLWVAHKDAIPVLISLLPPRGDAVRVNINIDANLLAAADAAAGRAHQSRSAFIARALENVLES